jgi:ABC-type branched-subunit amino acid transport system ATPase component
LSRIYQPTTGRILFEGRDLLDVRAHGIAQHGHLAHVPEPGVVAGDERAPET